MESVFGNIVLPTVQVQNLDHHSDHHSQKDGSEHSTSITHPVPKQRHELSSGHSTLNSVPVLEREREFHASFLNSEPGEPLEPIEFRKNTIDRHHSINSHGEHHELASQRSESVHSQSQHEHHEVASQRSASIHSRALNGHQDEASHKSASIHSRRESTISRKSEPFCDDVHSHLGEPNEILEPLAEVNI
jgi:hypothetical protein